jgi:hypothetical protein
MTAARLAQISGIVIGLGFGNSLGWQSAHAASLVNFGDNPGLCLDVKNANVSSGTGKVVAFTCNGTFAQQWDFEVSFPREPRVAGQTIRGLKKPTSPGGVSFCLDVFFNGRADGTPVDITQCNFTTAQIWRYIGGEIMLADSQEGSKCLTVHPGLTLPQPVTIQTCTGSPNQIWAIRS